jgi:DNA polymerase beta
MSKRKAPDSDNPNQEFVDFLFELAINEKNVARNVFKAKAYEKAASVLSKLPQRIKSGDEARKLDGIGAQIGKKIDEFIATGGLKKLEKIRNDGSSSAIILLTRVAGIGPAKARELVIDSGIETIEDLRENQETLTKGQMIGLKHFEDFEKRIPRDETIQIEAIVVRELDNLDPKYGVISYIF